jgi:hypothetical protein
MGTGEVESPSRSEEETKNAGYVFIMNSLDNEPEVSVNKPPSNPEGPSDSEPSVNQEAESIRNILLDLNHPASPGLDPASPVQDIQLPQEAAAPVVQDPPEPASPASSSEGSNGSSCESSGESGSEEYSNDLSEDPAVPSKWTIHLQSLGLVRTELIWALIGAGLQMVLKAMSFP